ncbi:MAG TPA: hypothetical protein DCZ23_02685 [Lachnospiraceae bacterium]|nr:hypothetical protein [Lachnospiraceae bacterium]
MRFRYKKLIIMFTVAIMFIGLGTFSLIAPSIDFSVSNANSGSSINNSSHSAINTVTIMSESEIKTAISSLVETYLDAKQRVDIDKLTECVSDADRIDNKRLVAEAEYIEEYKNIECTVKKGPDDGTYRVYVYYDVKVYDIDTLVPSLTALYIKSDSNNSFKIYLGTIDGEAQEAITKLDNSEEIKKIADSVQKRLEEIVASNEDVKDFYEMLESSNESNEAVEENENIHKEGTKATAKPK